MHARSTRRNARSLALVMLATTMLPLNGCVGAAAPMLGMVTQALGAITGVMNLGKTLGSLGGSTSGKPAGLPAMATNFVSNTSGSSSDQNSVAAQSYLSQDDLGDAVDGVGVQGDSNG